jgi:hypothetical protein
MCRNRGSIVLQSAMITVPAKAKRWMLDTLYNIGNPIRSSNDNRVRRIRGTPSFRPLMNFVVLARWYRKPGRIRATMHRLPAADRPYDAPSMKNCSG